MPVEEPTLAVSALTGPLLPSPVLDQKIHTALVQDALRDARDRVEVLQATLAANMFSLAQWQSPFKAQNDRGTCWAFAGAAALEAAYRRKFGTEIDVSEEYIFHMGKSFALNRDAQGAVVQPVENNSSLTGFQGCGDVVKKLSENAVPAEGLAPYLPNQQALLDILPTLGFAGGQGSLQSQEDFDAIEFCEQHIPLLARVNARYRVADWAVLPSPPSATDLENTLLAGHEVVADVTGHVVLLIGFDRNRQVFFAKNHWGENAFVDIAYQNDPTFGSIQSGWYIKDVVDPTFVQNEACWLGPWFLTLGGDTHRLLLRRSEDFVSPGAPTRFGSVYLGDGRHDVNGQFLDGGAGLRLFLAPGTGSTAPGTLQGTQIDARLDFTDIYNLDGTTAAGDRVTLSRFTTRFAALWEPDDGSAWQARHGITATDYQQTFDTLTAEGFRLSSVCGYGEGREARFNAMWIKRDGPPWQARHGLDAEQYQATFDELVAQGFRLVDVSGYAEAGQARYAAIWEQRPGPDWQARHGLSRQQYQATFDELAAQGFAPRKVCGYRVGVDVRFAALWEREQGIALVARHGLTASQYQTTFDELLGQGFRLAWVNGYSDTGTARYAAVWRREPAGRWEARHGLTAEDYQLTFDKLSGEGLRPVTVSGYGDGAWPA